MQKLPDNWGKGSVPKGWNQNSSTPFSKSTKEKTPVDKIAQDKINPTSNMSVEPEKKEEYFYSEDELKAKIDAVSTEIDKGISDAVVSVRDSVQSVEEKIAESSKTIEDQVKSKLLEIKGYHKKQKQTQAFDENSVLSSDPMQEKTENDVARNKAHGRMMLFLVGGIVIVAIVLASVIMIAKWGKSSTEQSFHTTETASAVEMTEPDMHDDNYIGYWHLDDSPQTELAIHRMTDKSVEFTFWNFPADPIQLSAERNGSVASFTYNYEDGTVVKGIITFNDASVSFDIIESNNSYMPIISYTFYTRHQQSWCTPGNGVFAEQNTTSGSEGLKQSATEYTDKNGTVPVYTQAQTAPSAQPIPETTTKSVVVNGITFQYQSAYTVGYYGAVVDIQSVEIYPVVSALSNRYEFRLDWEVSVAHSGISTIKYYEYDEQGYLLNRGYLCYFSTTDVAEFKESHNATLDEKTVRVELKIE